MSKAFFFDPYLDTIGGGERYTLTLAEHLSNNNWTVDLVWSDLSIKEKIRSRLDLKLDKINLVSVPVSFLEKRKITKNYDLSFWVSDGSVPLLFSKQNIMHCQVPFHHVNGSSFWNQLKLTKIKHIVCNSNFTKRFIDKEYKVDSKVVYPPVDITKLRSGKKENIILSVGRFSQLLQAKRQDILVDSFKEMVGDGLVGWRLILVGGTDVGGKEYLEQLRKEASGYPIEFFDSPDFRTLQKIYGQAKIFWSASGFGIDENREPEKVEHFGITLVEAMAAGCVPVIVGKGGLKEIIQHSKNGFVWQTKKELIDLTRNLIVRKDLFAQMVPKMIKLSERFSKERFIKEFSEIINSEY